jgi:hypothetical protein
MRPSSLWLLLAAVLLLLGAIVAACVLPAPAPWASEVLLQSWGETTAALAVLLVLPLTMMVLVLSVLCSSDNGPSRRPKGELEDLIRRKHQGTLLLRSRRIRENAARVSRHTADTSQAVAAGRAPSPFSGQVLDRLLEAKGRGAWAPRARRELGPEPAPGRRGGSGGHFFSRDSFSP